LTGNDDNVAPLYARHQIGVQQSKQTVPLITNAMNNNNQVKIKGSSDRSKGSKVVKMKLRRKDSMSTWILAWQQLAYTLYPMFGVPIIRVYEQ
jgi:hypothetical protein